MNRDESGEQGASSQANESVESQTNKLGGVRRSNASFTLKSSSPDFQSPAIHPIEPNGQPEPTQAVVVGESVDHHRLWVLAGEEVSESRT